MQLTTTQREHLERRLQEERARVLRDLNRQLGDFSDGDEQDRAADLTKAPFHLADRGSRSASASALSPPDSRRAEGARVRATTARPRLRRHLAPPAAQRA